MEMTPDLPVTFYHSPSHADGGGVLLAYIVRTNYAGPGLEFHSDAAEALQVATIDHPAGHAVPGHWHPPVPRQIARTQEVLVVTGGMAELDLYDPHDDQVCHTVLIGGGMVVVLFGTGHGLRVCGKARFTAVEVKVGPYVGKDRDKVLIEKPSVQ